MLSARMDSVKTKSGETEKGLLILFKKFAFLLIDDNLLFDFLMA